MTQPEEQEAPPEATVTVINLLEPVEDSVASMGNLDPIEFTAGKAEMTETEARELHYVSSQFVLQEEYEAMKAAEAEAEAAAPPDPEPEAPVEPESEPEPDQGV